MAQDAQHNEHPSKRADSSDTSNEPTKSDQHLSQQVVRMVLQGTSVSDEWTAGTDIDREVVEDEYPSRNPRSGGIKLMEWVMEEAEDDVLCTIWKCPEAENPAYTIEFVVDWGLYHGHSADSLDSACEAASAMMHMFAHHRLSTDEVKPPEELYIVLDLASEGVGGLPDEALHISPNGVVYAVETFSPDVSCECCGKQGAYVIEECTYCVGVCREHLADEDSFHAVVESKDELDEYEGMYVQNGGEADA